MVGMFQEIYSELGLSGPLVSAATICVGNEHPVFGKYMNVFVCVVANPHDTHKSFPLNKQFCTITPGVSLTW